MAKLWLKHSHGVEGKNWTASHLKKNSAFTLYRKCPPLRVTTILNQMPFPWPQARNKPNMRDPLPLVVCGIKSLIIQPCNNGCLVAFPPPLPSFLSFLYSLFSHLFSPGYPQSTNCFSQQQFPFSLIMFYFISNSFY